MDINDCGAGSEQVNVMPLKMSGQLRSGELRGHFGTRALDEKDDATPQG